MSNKVHWVVFKTIAIILILLFFNLNALPKFIANITETAFQEQEKNMIGATVMEGAGYFLKSQSQFLLLLNKIELEELDGVNCAELRDITQNAISNLENAQTKYAELVQFTEKSLYNPEVITKLQNFDYTNFQKSNQFNSLICGKVQQFLMMGDVRGIYAELLSICQDLLGRFIVIQAALDADHIPLNEDLWRMMQSYSETLLFGQLTAEVFYKISGK